MAQHAKTENGNKLNPCGNTAFDTKTLVYANEVLRLGYVIERMLNHQQRNPLERIYQRQSLEAEQREGWRLIGERLELLTNGASNVVTLKRTA